jgi:peroxiredoxin
VLAPGDRVPDVTLFGNDLQPVRLVEFAAEGLLLLAFYLYDWTGT